MATMNDKGFTLVESLIGLSIAVFIATAIYTLLFTTDAEIMEVEKTEFLSELVYINMIQARTFSSTSIGKTQSTDANDATTYTYTKYRRIYDAKGTLGEDIWSNSEDTCSDSDLPQGKYLLCWEVGDMKTDTITYEPNDGTLKLPEMDDYKVKEVKITGSFKRKTGTTYRLENYVYIK